MPTTRENRDFREALFADDDEILNRAIKFIRDNFEIQVVYSDKDIKEYVLEEFDPEGIYSANELAGWATENGYVLKDE